jgi:hypothetical protein
MNDIKNIEHTKKFNQSQVLNEKNSEMLRKYEYMANSSKFIAERTIWRNNFPDVIVHTTVKERNAHVDYQAGKTGDVHAAFRLANDLISHEMIEKIKLFLGEEKPIVLPVSAIERHGINCIPEAMAKIIAERLDLSTEKSIVQSNIVNHSRARAFERMAFPATFAGEICLGQKYIIVDDHVGLGGTLANLKGFIEKNGGYVILTTTLSASHNSQYLVPTIEQINGLKQKHGEALNEFLQREFGHDIDKLTRAEAGQLLSAKDVETIRDRIFEATSGRIDENLSKNAERKKPEKINDFGRTKENLLAD